MSFEDAQGSQDGALWESKPGAVSDELGSRVVTPDRPAMEVESIGPIDRQEKIDMRQQESARDGKIFCELGPGVLGRWPFRF